RRGPLSVGATEQLVRRVAGALAEAHGQAVIHRDLKPSNLFLPAGEVGMAKVLDFGIAYQRAGAGELTRPRTLIRTPGYMAPEQARGEISLTPAADIFALGCVSYECLTGRPPFGARSPMAVLVRILFEEPERITGQVPLLPRELSQLVYRMLRKDPSQRFSD